MLPFLKTEESQTHGRLHYEECINNNLSCYHVDTIRVTYSTSFRKLEYKTQVFFNNEGDYYRTRLTHSLEVAQISKIICKMLGLNSELSEVISLIHDMGHTPFGHAGEDGLNNIFKKRNLYKFNHNEQSVRVVDKLEKRYCSFNGLNLSYETIDGLLKHNGIIKYNEQSNYIKRITERYKIDPERITHLEGQVSSISDDIAYTNHDIEDGYRSGILKFEELLELPIIGECILQQEKKYRNNKSDKMILYEAINQSIDIFINDVIEVTLKNIKEHNIRSREDLFANNKITVRFSDQVFRDCKIIREYLLRNFYKHPEMSLKRYKMMKVIGILFEFFSDNPNCLPFDWQDRIQNQEDDITIIITDFIAGMTDRYALDIYEKIG